MEKNLCQLPEIGLSCFGCCGHTFKDKQQVSEDLRKNTIEFSNADNVLDWANRSPYLRRSGVCRNLIKKDDEIFCPLHPLRNDGEDLREAHLGHSKIDCDTEYLCSTFYAFNEMDKKTQKEFVKFIKIKNPNWYDFSINVDNGNYLKEFNTLRS